MKRKVMVIALIVAIAAIIGSFSLAFFTDTDAQKNTFVIGDVKIDLYEDFNTDEINLIPSVPCTVPKNEVCPVCGVEDKDCDKCINTGKHNQIEKEVYVENIGNEPAYVRVHIAVPALKDGVNAIGVDMDEHNTVDGTWIWGTELTSNYPGRDGGTWNMYRNITIDGVPYKVFVVTYESILNPGDVTVDCINHASMQSDVTYEDINDWNDLYGDKWKNVYVMAEAVQAEGFTDAITALNEAFGDPQADGYTAPDFFGAEEENSTFVEVE